MEHRDSETLRLCVQKKKDYEERNFETTAHDLNPQKACPCFNAAHEYASL